MTEHEPKQQSLFAKYLSELSDPEMIGEVAVTCKFRLPYLVGSARITQEEYEILLKAALTNINNQIPLFDDDIEFANEQSKNGYELTIKVNRLLELLPSDSVILPRFKTISFTEEHKTEALSVAFAGDTSLPTGENNTLHVSQKTVLILRVLEIPHKVID